MKILNIVSLQTKGGVEVIYTDICRASQYSNVTFSSGSSIHPEVRQHLNTLAANTYQHNRLGIIPIPKISAMRQAHFERLLRSEKPDLIVGWNRLHDMPILPSDIPFIHYEHGTSWYEHPIDDAMKILERADKIIAASFAAKRMLELKWFKAPQAKIVVNRNALPTSRTQTGPRSTNEFLHIGFAGRFHPVKAPWTVVETTAALVKNGTKVHAFFAGKGQLLEETKKLAQDLNVSQHCSFLGLVSDMPAFYRKLDYLIVPSIREPFGLVPVEAMAQRCIPIVCNVDGLVESMGEFASILSIKAGESVSQINVSKVYEPASDTLRDPQSLFAGDVVKTILKIEANPDLKKQITQYLENRSQKDFTFEKYLRDQELIYSSVEAK
jgi:glycosyltransferase involved in cell wall biosynthesis